MGYYRLKQNRLFLLISLVQQIFTFVKLANKFFRILGKHFGKSFGNFNSFGRVGY